MLDGLFHEQVVICESDADCRFYAAMVDSVLEGRGAERRPDVMFTATGGKDRMPTVLSALTRLGVPACVIADFDVLNRGSLLRELWELLGGTWAEIENDWSGIVKALEQKSPPLSTPQVKERLRTILDGVTEPRFPERASTEIKNALKAASPWAAAKDAGIHGVPNGQPSEIARRLLARLRARGLFVVECGELERFLPSAGGHGPSWVAEALQRDLREDPELADARRFADGLLDFITGRTGGQGPCADADSGVPAGALVEAS